MIAVGLELLSPTLVSPDTVAHATAVSFPGLGRRPTRRRSPGPQRLGSGRRGAQPQAAPLGTGSRNSAGDVRAYFGAGPGPFLWVDPSPGLTAASLADRPFGPWAMTRLARVSL